MKNAIGQLKAKTKAYCTICGCGITRNIIAPVYENTPAEIERAQNEIKAKAAKEYTCRICVSIIKAV